MGEFYFSQDFNDIIFADAIAAGSPLTYPIGGNEGRFLEG